MEAKHSECEKSLTGKHEWVYPKMEPSIDKERKKVLPYCKHCLQMQKETQIDEKYRTENVYSGIH